MRSSLLCLVLGSLAFAQKPEVVLKEVVRDVGILQDDVRDLRKEAGEIKAMLQQVLDQTKSNATAMAKIDATVRERMREQEKSLSAPLAGLSAKVDSMAEDSRYVKESMNALTERIGRLDQKLTDTNNAIKVLQAPPAPPPASGSPAAPPPGTSSAGLFKDAMRDKGSGNYDLALEELSNYLKWFGTSEDAPLAEYYVGEIHYAQKRYEEALKAFDAVLEKYPKNPKTLDAALMKSQSMVKLGQRNEAAEMFREIIRVAPNSDQANRARQELRALGLSPSATPPPTTKKKR